MHIPIVGVLNEYLCTMVCNIVFNDLESVYLLS
jgi:hypothetical protein